MVDDLSRLDDDFVYGLQDLVRDVLRQGQRRARKNGQHLAAEKVIGIHKAITTLGEVLVKGEATEEAAATGDKGSKGDGKLKGSTNGRDEGTFPT
jgi:hypothetical protein